MARQEGLSSLGADGAVIKQGVRQGAAIDYAMVDLPDSLSLCIYGMSKTPCANRLEVKIGKCPNIKKLR